jgi:hypothetical protein
MQNAIPTTDALQPIDLVVPHDLDRIPALPWRDPHSVPPQRLGQLIAALHHACSQNPKNAPLRILLGMAHAMNYDVYESISALESAIAISPHDFLARLKYGEIFYRVRAVNRAEEETLRALELAVSPLELCMARKQLSLIRQTAHGGNSRPPLTKSLRLPATALAVLLAVISCLYLFAR